MGRFSEEDIAELEMRPLSAASLECAICLAGIETDEEVLVLPCAAAHRFHPDCARGWLRRNVTCPLCRVDVLHLIRSRSPRSHSTMVTPRAMGQTRDGGVILRYEPRPSPEVARPSYIPPDLHAVAELVE